MKVTPLHLLQRLFATLALATVGFSHTSKADEVLAGWNTSGISGGLGNSGPSPFDVSVAALHTTVGGLTRGSGVSQPAADSSGAARGWGGVDWVVSDLASAVTGNKFVSFTIASEAGYKLSFTTIDKFDYRRSTTGASTGVLQYQIGIGGPFVDVPGILDYSGVATTGASLPPINLATISALQNIPSGTLVTFRIVNYGGSNAGGAWYIYDFANTTAPDFSIRGVVSPNAALPPTITNFTPSTGGAGSSVTITGTEFGTSPTVSFNGTQATGAVVNGAGTSITVNVPLGATTGPITVTAASSVTSAGTYTVLPQPALAVNLLAPSVTETAGAAATSGTIVASTPPATDLTINLTSSDVTEATVPATVTILAGQTISNSFNVAAVPDGVFDADATVTITAIAAGYDPGSAPLFVTNVDAPVTTVVVNKYMNSPDLIELLVIANGTPGSTVSMQGMVVKDYSANMVNDGGGKFTFNNVPLFAGVKAGTLITLALTTSSPDVDASDFTLSLGLLDSAYFTGTGSFDIATTDMVSIKAAGSSISGTSGAMHTLAGGSLGTGNLFEGISTAKLRGTGTTAAGFGVIAKNSTSTLDDFNGLDATGNFALTAASFGVANNLTNNAYIRALRGFTNLDGAGLATIVNSTAASPFIGKNIFPRNLPGQSVSLTLLSDATPGAIPTVRFTVPAAFGAPVAASVAVTGAGAGAPSISVTGQQVTVSGMAVTTSNAATITIGSLTTPNPGLPTDDGRYTFTMETASTGGTLTAAAAFPIAIVTIPINNLRDVTATGVPVDSGKVVAVEAVCTEENFNTSGTSAFVQDGDYGINLFASGLNLNLTRGKRYAVTGQITHFNGLTEIIVSSLASLVDLGTATQPTPLTITIPELLENAEAYEGRLIRIVGLSPLAVPVGSWVANGTITLTDGAAVPSNIDIRIQVGSTATTEPAYPAAITGIFGQFDSTTPYTTLYQLMPRDVLDVVGTGPNVYNTWITSFYPGVTDPLIIGFAEDPDKDGVKNGIEHVLGFDPSKPQTTVPLAATSNGSGGLEFTYHRKKLLATDITVSYEWSSNLVNWYGSGFGGEDGTVVTFGANDTVDTSSPDYDVVTNQASIAEGEPTKIFIRLHALK